MISTIIVIALTGLALIGLVRIVYVISQIDGKDWEDMLK